MVFNLSSPYLQNLVNLKTFFVLGTHFKLSIREGLKKIKKLAFDQIGRTPPPPSMHVWLLEF